MSNTLYWWNDELDSRHDHGCTPMDFVYLVRYIGEDIRPIRTHVDVDGITARVIWDEDTPAIQEMYLFFSRPWEQRRAGGKAYK